MSCSHRKQTRKWVESENWYTGEMTGEWEYSTEHTTVDIDTHRYKCTTCGEVMYYSSYGRSLYND